MCNLRNHKRGGHLVKWSPRQRDRNHGPVLAVPNAWLRPQHPKPSLMPVLIERCVSKRVNCTWETPGRRLYRGCTNDRQLLGTEAESETPVHN